VEKIDCVRIGRILKTFGYKGELVVQIDEEFLDVMIREGSVFIETDEELVPFFIEVFEAGDQDLHNVKLEDIDDVGCAKNFSGSFLWFPLAGLPEELPEQKQLRDIKGYAVVDLKMGEAGIAEDVIEMPQQLILRFYQGKKEILLPVNEAFIIKIDRKKKKITIDAPDGLIDSYLE
jgi:16S rRNA processing protein RimM